MSNKNRKGSRASRAREMKALAAIVGAAALVAGGWAAVVAVIGLGLIYLS